MNDVPKLSAVDKPTELARIRRRLTPLQRRVLRTMITDECSVWQACKKQSCSTASAHRWLRKPDFYRAHELTIERAIDEIDASARYVLGRTKEVVERSLQAKRALDEEGNPVGDFKFDTQAALKGLDMLGKRAKLWTDETLTKTPDGPGITVVVHTGENSVAVNAPKGADGRITVELPGPEKLP